MKKTKPDKIYAQPAEDRASRIGIAVTAAVFFGALYFMLFSAIGLTAARGSSVIFGCASAAVLIFIGKNVKRRIIFFAVLGAATAALALSNIGGVGSGFVRLINDIIDESNSNLHRGFEYLSDTGYSAYGEFAVAAIVSLWCGVLSGLAAKRIGVMTVACAVYTLFLLCWGLFPSVAAVIFAVLACAARCIVAARVPLKTSLIAAAAAVATVAVVGCGFLFTGSTALGGFRRAIADAWDGMLYGTDTLPQGRLKESGGMRSSKNERLTVTMPDGINSLYLKGFTGSTLVGSEWKETDRNVYVERQNRGLMEYISRAKMPFAQYSEYLKLSGKGNSYTVTVKNIAANSKYMYVPYTVDGFDRADAYYDMYITRGAFDADRYGYTVAGPSSSAERTLQERWVLLGGLNDEQKKYVTFDEQYRRFVYENYRAVDAEDKELIREKLGGQKADTVFSVSRLARSWFLSSFKFTNMIDPIEGEFAEDFFGGKIVYANAAYFASAATLIFRSYGFPARYVEGYRIKTEGGDVTASVTDDHAHAWTEVYFDGIGWLPIDVTPGYFTNRDLEEKDPGETGDGDREIVDPPEIEDDRNERPDDPPEKPEPLPDPLEGLSKSEIHLYYAMRVLVPIAAVFAAVALAALALVVRRRISVGKKRKKLTAVGEDYGRALIGVLDIDFRHLGGYSRHKAKALGLAPEDILRFTELVERAVYGGYDLSVGERDYAEGYISRLTDKLASSGGRIKKLYYKYLVCVGI